jgi:beta-RFAP synthase
MKKDATLKVRIVTPARLHLGIIDTCGDLGRLYGSIGVTIDRPNVVLEAIASESLKATGEGAERALKIAQTFLERFPKARCAEINISHGIPEHVGLGSGTQLSLAVGTAIAKLSGLDISVKDIAIALGRGKVSGIGVNAFEHGGFILDAGRRRTAEVKDIQSNLSLAVFQRKFPAEWRFVAAIPGSGRGLSGRTEKNAFSNLPPASSEVVGRICRLIIMKMLPSLMEKNIRDFGESMAAIQSLVGESFSQAQGGRFFNPLVEDCVQLMLESGAYGAGQSSWGPTVYGIVANDSDAEILKEHLEKFLNERNDGTVFVARANNDGARFSHSES